MLTPHDPVMAALAAYDLRESAAQRRDDWHEREVCDCLREPAQTESALTAYLSPGPADRDREVRTCDRTRYGTLLASLGQLARDVHCRHDEIERYGLELGGIVRRAAEWSAKK